MSNDLNLPHLVQVCEAVIPRGDGNSIWGMREIIADEDYDTFITPPTVLALLRRLMEAQEKLKGQQ